MTSRLSIADRDRVRHIALNRPEVHNAFDDALIAAVERVFADPAHAEVA